MSEFCSDIRRKKNIASPKAYFEQSYRRLAYTSGKKKKKRNLGGRTEIVWLELQGPFPSNDYLSFFFFP